MVKKHLKGMEIGITESEGIEIKTLWKANCDEEKKAFLTREFLLMAIEEVIGESVIVYKDKDGNTQFHTRMFLETKNEDVRYEIGVIIKKMLNEVIDSI